MKISHMLAQVEGVACMCIHTCSNGGGGHVEDGTRILDRLSTSAIVTLVAYGGTDEASSRPLMEW